jgi:hypothetical protein
MSAKRHTLGGNNHRVMARADAGVAIGCVALGILLAFITLAARASRSISVLRFCLAAWQFWRGARTMPAQAGACTGTGRLPQNRHRPLIQPSIRAALGDLARVAPRLAVSVSRTLDCGAVIRP